MERNVVIEICKNLKWYEKIVVVIFNKIFVKVSQAKNKTC